MGTPARAMPVRIRLARYGHRNLPFYRIYVADGRAPRDGRHIEIIGHYDPKPEIDGNKHMGLKIDRAKCVPSRPPHFALEEARRSFSVFLATHAATDLENARRRTRRYWLSVGAQPSDTVARLFGQ